MLNIVYFQIMINIFKFLDLDEKVHEKIYEMIETLLPKARVNEKTPKGDFKMCELFAYQQKPRKHWIGFYQN